MALLKSKPDEPIDCPKCFVKMNKIDAEIPKRKVVMDACPSCNGIWLDKDELGKILENKKLSNYLTKQIGTKTESSLVCPRCGNLMDHEHAEEVVVDVCLNCAGIWLDPGELADLQGISASGYEGDPKLKAEELEEEHKANKRRSLIDRFARKIYK